MRIERHGAGHDASGAGSGAPGPRASWVRSGKSAEQFAVESRLHPRGIA